MLCAFRTSQRVRGPVGTSGRWELVTLHASTGPKMKGQRTKKEGSDANTTISPGRLKEKIVGHLAAYLKEEANPKRKDSLHPLERWDGKT